VEVRLGNATCHERDCICVPRFAWWDSCCFAKMEAGTLQDQTAAPGPPPVSRLQTELNGLLFVLRGFMLPLKQPVHRPGCSQASRVGGGTKMSHVLLYVIEKADTY